ncbi:MAG TPA: hypothetical protein VHE80_00335, partial [Acidimicrobiales bacterium]|nr:hypothetical protein [Acidimicrobiales bacterium]
MRKRFFDEGKGPSREDLEREAAAELSRFGVGRPPPPGGSMPPPRRPSRPPPPPDPDDLEDEDEDEDYFASDQPYTGSYDEAAVTEMALQDLAARPGRSGRIEDMAIGRLDPTSAEAMRDRALQAAIARQEQLAKFRQGGGGVVGARKAQPVFARPQVWTGMVSGLHPEQPPPMVAEVEEPPPPKNEAAAKRAAKKAAKKAAAKNP